MTKRQGQPERDLITAKFDAELREADARLNVLQARAEGSKAKTDMDEISGLAAARDRVKKNLADLKQEAAADYAATKREVEKEIRQLQDGIQRVNERVVAWDAARERQFYARLDEADAKLELWKAQADQKRADVAMKVHDDIATLEEKIALARARSATAKNERYSAKSLTALEEAERYFIQAYAAAAKRYDMA
jgi:uncharacterized protein YfcZ (UPF0381/DUF406 family)